jgi:hypothetical protein
MKNLATMIVLVILTALNGSASERVEKNSAIHSVTFAAIHNLNVPMVSVDRRIGFTTVHTRIHR